MTLLKTWILNTTVHKAEMKVPYEIDFDFGGKQKSIYGMWQGVATSIMEVI